MHTEIQVCYTSVQCISCVHWISILSIPQGVNQCDISAVNQLTVSPGLDSIISTANKLGIVCKIATTKTLFGNSVYFRVEYRFTFSLNLWNAPLHTGPRWRCLLCMTDHCGSNRFHLLSVLSCSQSCHSVLPLSLSLAICFCISFFVYYFVFSPFRHLFIFHSNLRFLYFI
jgi:hypothetical protein